jgi:fructose-specific phosphotransferase system IIA component
VAEVSARLKQFALRHNPPLLEPELVIVNSDATTKEEVIKQATDLLFVTGRTDDSRAVEDAIWQREASYSTGFGHGFAIPHCKNAGVRYNSLVLLKPRSPIAWNSLDGEPVNVVITLAIREEQGDSTHMKVLARLARKVMNEEFRARLAAENDPVELCATLQRLFED